MFEIILKYLPRIMNGTLLTLELVFLSVIFGLIIALPLGIATTSKKWQIKLLPTIYITIIRGTPLMVQLFLVYYGLSQFEAIRNSFLWTYLRDAYYCALIVMTLHTAAYIAEIVRGAIMAIPKGEIEAATALGFNYLQTLFSIILPRALRIGLPAYSNEVVLMLKASSLASTITLLELTGTTRTVIARTYMSIEFFCLSAIIYLLITVFIVFIFRMISKFLHIPQ